MRLRDEIGVGIGAILATQLVVAMLAIMLLNRMGPAIERIMRDNVFSAEAVEEMLAELAAESSTTPTPKFEAALGRALENITEAEEQAPLEVISSQREAAFSGDARARASLVDALRHLGTVNRASMQRADTEAKQLAGAGAWSTALLGGFAVGMGLLTYRRLRVRLELPVIAIGEAASRVRAGDGRARVMIEDAPAELRQIASDLNAIVDAGSRASAREEAPEREDREADVRRALGWMLDEATDALCIEDAAGRQVVVARRGVSSARDVATSREPVPGTSLTLVRAARPEV